MFDAQAIKNDIVKWIRDFFKENGDGCNAIVGISGGKDSSVVAALCVEALGKERVLGILMPNREQSDFEDALRVVGYLGIDYIISDIGDMFDGFMKNNLVFTTPDTSETYRLNISEQTKINLPPRLRMAVLYAIAQSCNGRVANTCNLSEDWIGYSTRYGDSVGDFSPLSDLTVTEVREIGHALGLPSNLVDKVPSDGLCGKTDEDNFGFTYDVLDKYIRTGKCEDREIKKCIDELHRRNGFKLRLMPKYEYNSVDNDLLKYTSAELLKSLMSHCRQEPRESVDFAIALRSGDENSHNHIEVPICVLKENRFLIESYLAMNEVGGGFSIYINKQETKSSDEDDE